MRQATSDPNIFVVYDTAKKMQDGESCQMVIYEDVSTKDYYPRVMYKDKYCVPHSPNNSYKSYADAMCWIKDTYIRLQVEALEKLEQDKQRAGIRSVFHR